MRFEVSMRSSCVCRQSPSPKPAYVQKAIKAALDIAEEQPEGSIFVIPARLEPCVVPERLATFQWVDLGTAVGLRRLVRALAARATHVGAAALPDVPEANGGLTLV